MALNLGHYAPRGFLERLRLVAKQQRLKAGMLHDLLTRGLDADGRLRDPATHRFKPSPIGPIPEEWEVRLLADVVPSDRPIVYGILMPGEYVEGGVPVVKVRDVQGGEILVQGLLRTHPRIDAAYARSRLRAGDLLFTIRGSVGRMAVVPPELDRANITQDTARITVAEGSTTFIRHCLEMPTQKALVELNTIGQAVKGINLGEVRKIPVQFPEPDEQNEIARRLDSHDADTRTMLRELSKLRRLKAGLMHDLLTGRVPVTPLLEGSHG
jgi:type I restriction enzyme S subunit